MVSGNEISIGGAKYIKLCTKENPSTKQPLTYCLLVIGGLGCECPMSNATEELVFSSATHLYVGNLTEQQILS